MQTLWGTGNLVTHQDQNSDMGTKEYFFPPLNVDYAT